MALPNDKEVSALPQTTQADAVELGGYLLNVYPWQGGLRVRPGVGQIGQWDSTMGYPPPITGTGDYTGYTKRLGQYVMDTNFGHRQIVSLWSIRANTSDSSMAGKWLELCALTVYDETTGCRWEEVLHRHTSKNDPDSVPMEDWRGVWETVAIPPAGSTEVLDFQDWQNATDDKVAFLEYRDKLLFGSDRRGLWCYAPCDFTASRSQSVEGIGTKHGKIPYAESSRCHPVAVTDGIFADGFEYVNETGFPRIVDLAIVGARVALVTSSTREIHFTDPGTPGSIIAGNATFVPTDLDLTAALDVFGNLMVWTERETWLYRAPVGSAKVNQGDLTRLSSDIGCIGPHARCKGDDAVYWADRNGIYRTTGQYDLEVLSEPIDRLFADALPNPLQHFFSSLVTGYTGTDGPRLRLQYTWTDPEDVVLSFDEGEGLLFVSDPKQSVAFVCKVATKQWAVWSFETMMQAAPQTVGVTANLPNPVLLALGGDVYCIAGPESYLMADVSGAHEDWQTASTILCKWGRGGGLDRSVESQEDNRTFTGWYEYQGVVDVEDVLWCIDKPIPVPAGYVLPQGTIMVNGGVLLPVRLSPDPAFPQPSSLYTEFTFDNAHWRAVCVSGTAKVDAVVPPERIASAEGWKLTGVPIAGTAQVEVYTGAVRDALGNSVHMGWDGASADPYAYRPQMNIPSRGISTLLYLPFQRVTPVVGSTSRIVLTMNAMIQGSPVGAGPVDSVFCWNGADVRNKHGLDDVAQAVDWAVKLPQLGLDGPGQVKLRNLWTSLVSHGKGSDGLNPLWLWGLFNTITSSDWKEWASQIADFTTRNALQNVHQTKIPLRMRLRDTLGNLGRAVFGNPSPPTPTWGESGTPATGNVLVADEAVDTVAISDAVRGESVSALFFGHVADRAEALVIRKIIAGLNFDGERRRRGR